METQAAPKILYAERLSCGVVIEFADGRCAHYSDTLLYSLLPQADAVEAKNDDF